MSTQTTRVRLPVLVAEELRALPRNRFALGAFAAAFLAIALIGSVAPEGEGELQGFVSFFWIVGPLVVAVVVAARVAAVRRTRFVESLYTTPLTPAIWLAAQAIVGLVLAAIATAALVPFLAVHAVYLGVPDGVGALLLGSLFLGILAVGWGLVAGVAVGEAGPGAAAGLAAAMSVVSFLALFVKSLLLGAPTLGTGQAALLRAALGTPASVAVDAVGADLIGFVSEDPIFGILGFVALATGLYVAAAFILLRQQSPFGWERRPGRAALAILLAATLLAPAAFAGSSYREVQDEGGNLFVIDAEHAVALVPRGGPISDGAMTQLSYYESDMAFVVGEESEFDLLVLLRVPASAAIRDLQITLDGGSGLDVTGGLAMATASPDGKARESKGIGFPSDGWGPEAPVFRVPVTLVPKSTNALLDGSVPLVVKASFVADGERIDSSATVPIFVSVPYASAQLFGAGALLPVAALATLTRRTLATR